MKKLLLTLVTITAFSFAYADEPKKEIDGVSETILRLFLLQGKYDTNRYSIPESSTSSNSDGLYDPRSDLLMIRTNLRYDKDYAKEIEYRVLGKYKANLERKIRNNLKNPVDQFDSEACVLEAELLLAIIASKKENPNEPRVYIGKNTFCFDAEKVGDMEQCYCITSDIPNSIYKKLKENPLYSKEEIQKRYKKHLDKLRKEDFVV